MVFSGNNFLGLKPENALGTNFFTKFSIVGVWQCFEYASGFEYTRVFASEYASNSKYVRVLNILFPKYKKISFPEN